MVFCGFMMVVLLFKAISMIVVNPFVYLGQRPLVALMIFCHQYSVATLREIYTLLAFDEVKHIRFYAEQLFQLNIYLFVCI